MLHHSGLAENDKWLNLYMYPSPDITGPVMFDSSSLEVDSIAAIKELLDQGSQHT